MNLKTRILIADNNKDFVMLLVEFLSMYPDIEIIGVAHDGCQAIEMVRQTNPDILLLDIIMPVIDGIEALRKIRQENEQLKVFIISAIGLTQLIDNAKELGVLQYYVKPVDFNIILHAIRA